MIKEISAVKFRQNLGEMINQVQYRGDSVVINKDGKPVAALVDGRLFARMRRMQARFDALCDRLAAGFSSTEEAQGMAEIEAAVCSQRQLRSRPTSAAKSTKSTKPTRPPSAAKPRVQR